jgi:multiple sugar transport system permease protein
LRQQDWLPYAMIAPALVLVAAVALYPAVSAIQVSLQDMNLLRLAQARYVGLGNFVKLLQDDVFVGGLWRTLRWTSVIVIAQMAVALPVALFMNLQFRWRGLVRMVVLIPWIVPPAITAVLWVYLFDANFGVANELLLRLGLIPSYVAWAANDVGSFFILVMAMVWTGFPFMAIMLLAALQVLPADVYEAARLDGAGAWASFRYVTLPQLMPTILLLLLLRSMWLSHHIDIIYLITDGGPGVANYTLAIYSFKLASIQFNVGYASAVAVVLALILLVASLIYTRYIEKTREYLG